MKPTRKILRRKTFVEEDGNHRGPGCKSADFVIDMWAYMKYPRRRMGKKQKPTKEKKGAFRAKETNRKASSSIKKAKEKAIPRRKVCTSASSVQGYVLNDSNVTSAAIADCT